MDIDQINKDVGVFAEQLAAWAANALPNLLAAILIVGLGFWLSSFAARAIGRVVDAHSYVDPTLKGVLTQIVRWGVIAVTGIAALSQLGIQTTSLLAALGAIGLAVGLALQGTLSNIAAGVMLLWLRPFRVGDYVSVGDAAGTVTDVGLFASTFETFEGVYLFVPNGEVWNKMVTNFTRSTPRMVRVPFGIAYEDDIAQARKVILKAVKADERFFPDPEPAVFVSDLGDNAVGLELRAWTTGPDWVKTRFDIIERGKIMLDEAGISIPFPQRDLYIKSMPDMKAPAPPSPQPPDKKAQASAKRGKSAA